MTVLRLEAFAGANIDRAVSDVGAATLVRRGDGAFLEVDAADVPRYVRLLAFGGVGSGECGVELSLPAASLPAVGLDLVPLPKGLVAADIVRVRRLTLGDATRELLRRGTLRRPTAAAKESARALLHGEDALIAWTRVAWATRHTFGSRAVRRRLRPVIFDRAAVERTDLRGRTLASSGALTRWLFG